MCDCGMKSVNSIVSSEKSYIPGMKGGSGSEGASCPALAFLLRLSIDTKYEQL